MMTTIAIAPRMYSNIMDNPSQIVAGAKVKRGDRKGRNANGDEDKVENEAQHWRSFLARPRPPTRVLLLTCYQDGDRLLGLVAPFRRTDCHFCLKLLQASNRDLH